MNRIAILLAVAACGDNTTGTTFVMRVGDEAPAYGDAPFPTDALKQGDTIGSIAGLDRFAHLKLEAIDAQIGALDGFGVRPLVELFVDGALDPESVPATSAALEDAVGLVDVDPASPERGRVIAMDWRYDAERAVLQGSPHSGQVLRDGTRYAAFATTALRDDGGSAIQRAPGLDALADHARWQSTAEAVAELDQDPAGGVRDDLAAIATFTTQRASAPLVAARTAMAELAAPELTFDDPDLIFTGAQLDTILGVATRATDGPRAGLERWGNDNPTGIAHDHVGMIATGELTVARFRRDDTKTDGPDDETFEVVDGVPQLQAIERIPITFILPSAPAPAEGYPVIVYGHGLGASRDQLLSFAEPLTSQGYALVGIDMVGHGSRFDADDRIANMSHQLAEFSGDAGTRDGFGDTTGSTTQFGFFEGFLNVSAVRDSIRQSALDISRVVQLVRHPDLQLPGNAKLDARRVVYMGESFGTVVGTLLAAIEPDIDLYVLDVPGGGILDLILPASPEISQLALPLIEAIYAPQGRLDRWHPLIGLMQAAIDGGDPLTYAPHILRDRFTIAGSPLSPRSVIAIEVVGDQVLCNAGTDALATGLGLHALEPHLDIPEGMPSIAGPAAANLDDQTAVLVQYSPATHGANWSAERGTLRFQPGFPVAGDDPFPPLPQPITIANPIYETLDQVFAILASHRANGVPTVQITKPPVRDFDGDGVTDDTDGYPNDPAMQ